TVCSTPRPRGKNTAAWLSTGYPSLPRHGCLGVWIPDSRRGARCSADLHVAGPFAIWSYGSNLFRRNLQTKVTITVAGDAGNWMNDVTADGDVVYWNDDYDIV